MSLQPFPKSRRVEFDTCAAVLFSFRLSWALVLQSFVGYDRACSVENRKVKAGRFSFPRAEAEAVPYAGDDEYICIDLSAGPEAVYYPVRPIAVGTFTDRKTGVVTWKDAYKTKGLVRKRIRPGTLESHGLKFQITRPSSADG